MAKFKDMKTLQKLSSTDAALYNLFKRDGQATSRSDYKRNGSAPLTERYQVLALSWLD